MKDLFGMTVQQQSPKKEQGVIVVRHRSNDWYLGKGYVKGTYNRRGVDDISKAQRFRTVKTAKNALRQIGYSEEAISQMEVVNINDPEKRGYEL